MSAYKPPSLDNSTFTCELSRVLDEAFVLCENIICIGDLNSEILHPLCDNKLGKCLLNINNIYDLDSLINKLQSFTKYIETCIYFV